MTAILKEDTAVTFSPRDFDGFFNMLRDPSSGPTVLSPKRFVDALNIDLQTLAGQARVHRNTLSRAPASESVQKYMRESLRVVRAATDLNGDIHAALYWFRNSPLPPFRYKSAEQLVSEGLADDVLRYIASLTAGVTG